MEKYIAFLRGINVGGKNKVSMERLKASFEEIGFVQVTTYINSGNVIFKSEIEDISKLISLCEDIINKNFQLTIPVCVITADELSESLENKPQWWGEPSEEEMVHQAIFLIPPMTPDKVFAAIGETKRGIEKVGYYKNVIFWSAAKATFSKTRWSKISGLNVYSKVTIRNANTARKILSLCDKLL